MLGCAAHIDEATSFGSLSVARNRSMHCVAQALQALYPDENHWLRIQMRIVIIPGDIGCQIDYRTTTASNSLCSG